MEYLCTHTDSLTEGGSTYGANHKLLECDGGIRVRTTVDDVHHRNGEALCVCTTNVAIEGHTELGSSSVSGCERNAKNSVCTEVALGLGTVEFNHSLIYAHLVEYVHTDNSGSNLVIYVSNGFQNAFAEVATFVAITKFESLVLTGRSTAGNSSTTNITVCGSYLYLDSGVTPRIKNLSCVYA